MLVRLAPQRFDAVGGTGIPVVGRSLTQALRSRALTQAGRLLTTLARAAAGACARCLLLDPSAAILFYGLGAGHLLMMIMRALVTGLVMGGAGALATCAVLGHGLQACSSGVSLASNSGRYACSMQLADSKCVLGIRGTHTCGLFDI